MRIPAILVLCAVLVAGLTGCPARPPVSEPARIGNSVDYPEQAAGFRRGDVFDYAKTGSQDPVDLSIGYNLLTEGAQIASTIYVTNAPRVFPGLLDMPDPVRAIYEDHKSAIVQHHAGATLLGETAETLVKSGREYPALLAAYRFDEVFMGNRQPVYSVLMVWRHGDNIVKLRSTAPFAQGPVLMTHNRKLLDAVNWTVFPSAAAGQVVDRGMPGPAETRQVLSGRS